MPSVSRAQFRFFEAMKQHPDEARRRGIDRSVADEFTGESPQGLPEHVRDRHPAVVARHRTRQRER